MAKLPQAAQNEGMRRRTRLVAVLFTVLFFGTILVRLYILQIRDHDFYAGRAAGQQLRDSTVPAPRGQIISADGTILAANAACWTIRVSPREMEDDQVEPAAKALAQILELEETDVLQKLQDRHSNDKLLRRRVDKEMADGVRRWCAEHQVKGVQILEDTKRYYPEGDFAASLLGFTNVDNNGMAGLELKYNEALTGRNGLVLTAKNAWGYDMPTHYAAYVPPVEGNSLTLTIDANIQHYLEKYLTFAVKEHHVAARAVGIVMDVKTGAVLAISTKPDYDPNQPRVIQDEQQRALVDSKQGEERSAALQLAQQTQWRNKAVSDLYEPGSVFKLITCSAALDCGAVAPSDTFFCGESINVAGTRFHCANRKRHGTQDVALALKNSCNQSFIQIGQKLGKERFFDYFKAFGLCEATGIDLPAEPKKSEFYTAKRMGPVELASCSFGQSSKITPIQVVTAVSAIVNGGHLMQPYLVSEITDAQGKTVKKIQPTEKRRVISEQTSRIMCGMMEGVVDGGSGKNAYVAGYRVGGKTGTSQKLDSQDEKARIASFVGIAPVEDPRIAVLIALDEPHSFATGGGALAAPVAAQVIEDTLTYYGIPHQYTPEERERLETQVPDMTRQLPDRAVEQLSQAGLGARVLGSGESVVSQFPEPGITLPRGSTVLLYTQEGIQQRSAVVPAVTHQDAHQAQQTLAAAGFNLRAKGIPDQPGAVAAFQSIEPGTAAPLGSIVEVRFYDPTVVDDE